MEKLSEQYRNTKLKEMSSYQDPDGDMSIKTPIESLVNKIAQKRSTILAGPPGTGKTKMVLDVTEKLATMGSLGVFHSVQFHPQYTYQDFIDGYPYG